MNPQISEILARIAQLEEQLEAEFQRRRNELQADFENRRIQFEETVLAQQKRFKLGLLKYFMESELRNVLTMPFIYSLIIPMILLDLGLSIYQWICFPLYRIEKVKRSDCWVYDRAHLAYLNIVEKINCAYCSYGNGLAAYFREIASRTEQYWCPIKHAKRLMHAHSHYNHFVDYGDAENYQNQLKALRLELQSLSKQDGTP